MTNYTVVDTEHGFVGLAGRDGRLLRSTLPKSARDEALRELKAGLDADAVEDSAAFGSLPGRIRGYFRGEEVNFDDVDVDLTSQGPFHAAVLKACQAVPRGRTVSYQDLARIAGSPRACRAAGSAMARNQTPIVVPCHRVLASGGIGGFASGLEWKRTLLKLEGVDI